MEYKTKLKFVSILEKNGYRNLASEIMDIDDLIDVYKLVDGNVRPITKALKINREITNSISEYIRFVKKGE